MPEPLRNNGNIRDELNIINGKVTIIRRIGNDGSILANEVIEEYDDINLETFDKDTYIYIREYPNVEYFCRYVIDNDYLDTFATQQELQEATVELNSLIEQKQAEITLLVSRKVGKDEVISSINMTPEKIKILARLLELEGYTTINGGFKIDEKGNMEAVDGIFNGGEFYLYSEDNYPSITVSKKLKKYEDPYSSIYPDSIVVSAGNGKGTTIGMSAGETDNAQLYVLGTGGGTWVHHDKINCMGDIHAYAYKYDSKVELKENIRKIEIDALKLINETDIYEFDYKGNLRNKTIGLIIGEGYRTPKEVISEGNSINSYSMNSISWKAIQELDQKVEKLLNILKKIPILGRIITKRWKI